MRLTERKLRAIIRQVIKENSINEMIDMMNFGGPDEVGRYGTMSDHEFLKANFKASNAREYTKKLEHMLRALGVAGASAPVAAIVVSMSTSPLLGLAAGSTIAVGSIFCVVLAKLIELSSGTSGDKHVDAYNKLLEKLREEGYDSDFR